MERREAAYGSQAQALAAHAAPFGSGRSRVQQALAADGGQRAALDPPHNFHGEKTAAELARAEAEAVRQHTHTGGSRGVGAHVELSCGGVPARGHVFVYSSPPAHARILAV